MPPVEPRRFRQLMGRFPTGVAVIVAAQDGQVRGMTVNSLTSVSLEPPLLLFCARHESRCADLLLGRGLFSVNLLSRTQETLSGHFAKGGDASEAPLVEAAGWTWVDGATATFLCRVEAVHEAGDHRIILGRVEQLFGPDAAPSPLVFHDGRYAAVSAATA